MTYIFSRGYPREHELMEDLKRKDFIACRAFEDVQINQKDFLKMVIGGFRQADPFMRYLCAALEVPFWNLSHNPSRQRGIMR